MLKFKVMREHIGDKPYFKGDIRSALEADVAHLVRNGVLQPTSNKSQSVPESKATAAKAVSSQKRAAK